MVKFETNDAFGTCSIDILKNALLEKGHTFEMLSKKECSFPSIKYTTYYYQTNSDLNTVLDILNKLDTKKHDYIVGKETDCIKIIAWE